MIGEWKKNVYKIPESGCKYKTCVPLRKEQLMRFAWTLKFYKKRVTYAHYDWRPNCYNSIDIFNNYNTYYKVSIISNIYLENKKIQFNSVLVNYVF